MQFIVSIMDCPLSDGEKFDLIVEALKGWPELAGPPDLAKFNSGETVTIPIKDYVVRVTLLYKNTEIRSHEFTTS